MSPVKIHEMPMLPLRGMLVFPYTVIHLDVGRPKSMAAIDKAMETEEKLVFLVMQKDARTEEPKIDELYDVGTVCRIKQCIKLPAGAYRIMIEAVHRAQLRSFISDTPYITAGIVKKKEVPGAEEEELSAYCHVLMDQFEEFTKGDKRINPEMLIALNEVTNPGQLTDMIITYLTFTLEFKQKMLAQFNVEKRFVMLLDTLEKESHIKEWEKIINDKVNAQVEQNQKEYYLRERMKAIQDELGEKDMQTQEIEELRNRQAALDLPDYVNERLDLEIRRLERMPSNASEYFVLHNYIDWLLDIPWKETTVDRDDIKIAEEVLDKDHFGLEKPKERILEYLAAKQLSGKIKGPILCLVGPPGVGKTSLARSVADALNRKFVRISLGGVRDEAEIRGHRRTYVASQPGRIIQSMKTVGSRNPVFLLDEIDKLASDFRGDPSSALLEALDPEQNANFSDHYVEIPYDLSQVMFITTANVAQNIPRPLLDRMEVITLSGYTEEEKLHIAQRHLVPKQLEEHSLSDKGVNISENALRSIIRQYTKESGVRDLERKIGKICRCISRDIVAGKKGEFAVTQGNLEKYLGIPRYSFGKTAAKPEIGLVTGLAWTEVGGELLNIEAKSLAGSGKLHITGKLGDVMKESVQIAYTYVKSIAAKVGIPQPLDEKLDLHIHVPEGAIPKDGPSAGITLATAIASELSSRPVRSDIAMTGELTLRGKVLAIGGVKEKVLAARRGGCDIVILPEENRKDMEDIPANIKKKMQFVFVSTLEEVLDLVLLPREEQIAEKNND